MKFYEFGSDGKPVIMLLPGTCCHWKSNFGSVIPLLESDFHVVCVSYDGFDETEETVFPDMTSETEKIENYIKDRFGGKICCAYGCSLGGSLVSLLIQRKRVHIDHGIIGSSDMDQGSGLSAKLQGWLIGKIMYGVLQKGRLPAFMEKKMNKMPPEEMAYSKKMLEMFGMTGSRMSFVKRESIQNQFYSDLVTPVENGIDVKGTVIHCFYAVKMGEEYLKRYNLHFRSPDIRRHDMRHEELLICYPERWAEEVKRCCGSVQ